jgi:DNA mismatch repair ATPase MutL
MESRGQALPSMRRVAKLINISSKAQGERTWKTEFVRGRRGGVDIEEIDRLSSGTTVTMSGFLWNQEVRRKIVKEVAYVKEVRNGMLAIALIYPMEKFSLRNDTEGEGR